MNSEKSIHRRADAWTLFLAFWSSPWAPVLWAVVLFLVKAPYLDLPAWDDEVVYYNGWLLSGGDFGVVNFQWSPVLIFWTALINRLIPASPILGFYVFRALGHVFIALGAYAAMRSLETPPRLASALACVWSAFIHVLWFLIDFPVLHLYHIGVISLFSAYAVRKRPVSMGVLTGLGVLSFLIRNEAIVIMAILGAAGAWRRRDEGSPLFRRNIAGAALVWLMAAGILWVMSHDVRNWQGGRMEQAFRQKFYVYALSTVQYDAELPMTYSAELHVLNRAFGPGAVSLKVPQLFLRNPKVFLSFVMFNAGVIARGELFYGINHRPLSYFITTAFIAGLAAIAWAAYRRRQGWIALLLIALVIKLPLVMITVPRIRYFGESLMIAIFASWFLAFPRRGVRAADAVASILLLLAAYSLIYTPHYAPFPPHYNLKRAHFIRQVADHVDMRGKYLAEYFPTFSHAFGARELRESIPLDDALFQVGDKLYGRNGRLVDFVLIEFGQPVSESLRRWAEGRQPLISQGEFTLYRQTGPGEIGAPAEQGDRGLWVSDDYFSADDLSGGFDFDETLRPELAVKWNFDRLPVETGAIRNDVRVSVQANGGEFETLGRPFLLNMPFFEWRSDSPIVDEAFRSGPAFGVAYRFALSVGYENGGQADLAQTFAPVRLSPYVYVTDDFDSRVDLCGGADYDYINDRRLVIRWRFPDGMFPDDRVQDYHVYVRRKGESDLRYLGQVRGAEPHYVDWVADSELIAPEFRDGPQPGADYEFMLFVILKDRENSPKNPYRTGAPVAYRLTEGVQSSLSVSVTPGAGGRLGFNIAWRPESSSAPGDPGVNGYDVYAHALGDKEVFFIGRVLAGEPCVLRWAPADVDLLHEAAPDPVLYRSYEFAVYSLFADRPAAPWTVITSEGFTPFINN
ncbi:MAG: hypothetical protein GC179_30650 [Anaerolineaceae bacterium]|nr:hypothetical protein [Anaerolineaceae bacterium]